MSEALALPRTRRRRRRRRRPQGFEWVTLAFFVESVLMTVVCELTSYPLFAAVQAVLAVAFWRDNPRDRPEGQRGAGRIIREWVWGVAE